MIKEMNIGKSGVKAPQLVLGTFGMGGGTSWQDTTDNDQELVDFIRAAYDKGVWGLDTAPVYGTGRSEKIVGEAVKGRRENYYISTKCSLNWRSTEGTFTYTRDGYSVYNDFSAAAMTADVEESLARMDLDYIDLMIVHRTPAPELFPEVMDTMQKLKERGLIRAVGLSNVSLAADYEAAEKSLKACLNYGELDLLQEGSSLLKREYAEKTATFCREHGVTFQAHSSLEKGALAGKLIPEVTSWGGDNRSKYKWFQPDNIPKINALTKGLQEIAAGYNCSVPALCLAWMRSLGDNVNLLVGARHMESLTDTLTALDVVLKPEDIVKMNQLSDMTTGRKRQ